MTIDPNKCDEDIFRHGHCLCNLGESITKVMNELCDKMNSDDINKDKLVCVDWHFVAGNAVVLYIGDYNTAKTLIMKHIRWYDDVMAQHRSNKYGKDYHFGCGVDIYPANNKDIGQMIGTRSY